jgi:protein-disulfide isomerase
MCSLRATALLAATLLTVISACSRPETRARAAVRSVSAPATADGATVVAEVNGETITWAELEEKATAALTRVRQEEYDIRSSALDELIAQRLVEATAREEGISSEELLQREVEQRTEKPSQDYVESIYARARDRFKGQSRAKALARIEELLLERAKQESRIRFTEELREAAAVTVHLAPPRVALDIPAGAPATGPTDAPVTMVEFTDYQCPYCHRAQDTVEQILEEYKGRVRLVHLDYPLGNHSGAVPAAQAARCAGEQGRFWDYHRNLMTENGALDDDDLAARAASLKLDARTFAQCLASDRYHEAIAAEVDLGSSAGVTGTPAYFINGRLVSGARPFPDFAEIIDEELGGD